MNLSNTPCVNVKTMPDLGPHIKHAMLDFHDFLQEFSLVCVYTHKHSCICKQTVRFPFPSNFLSYHTWVYFSRFGLFRKTVYSESFFPFPEPGMLPLSETDVTRACLAAPFEVTGTACYYRRVYTVVF